MHDRRNVRRTFTNILGVFSFAIVFTARVYAVYAFSSISTSEKYGRTLRVRTFFQTKKKPIYTNNIGGIKTRIGTIARIFWRSKKLFSLIEFIRPLAFELNGR